MFKNFRDKIAVSGITVLIIGVALLIFAFVSAYGFLTQSLSIIASEDLAQTFGESLAPLIATCIRIMYLGVMAWIGSLITIRGVTIIAHAPQTPVATPQNQEEDKQQPEPLQKTKVEKQKESKKSATKQPETETKEPEIAVIPPEQAPQTKAQQEQQERK